jgi:hypothetical protein
VHRPHLDTPVNNLFLGSALATLVGKLLHCCARSPTKENISETLHGPLHGADSYGTKRKTLYGKTRREVDEKLTRATANRDNGLVFDADNLTVGRYLERWLTDSVRDTAKATTYESYERLIRLHLVPTLGRLKLKNLTTTHVRGLYRAKLDHGLSPAQCSVCTPSCTRHSSRRCTMVLSPATSLKP